MSWQFTPYVIPLILAALISISLGLYAWGRRKSIPAGTSFAVLMLLLTEWSLGYTLELGSTDLPTILFWARVEYLGIALVTVAWFVFALQFANQDKWLTRRNLILLAVVPAFTQLVVWTNEAHGLMWSRTALDTSGPFPALDTTFGPWFWVHSAYSYVLLLLGTILIIRSTLSSPRLYRLQSGFLLLAVLAPWLANGLYLSGLSPLSQIDLTPFAFTLTGLALAWSLFQFRFLDLAPVAHQAIVESMGDGVIVLDEQNRIVDLNPAAQQIIGRSAATAVGQVAGQVFAAWPDLVERYRTVFDVSSEIVLGVGAAQRYFDLRISPLLDRRRRLTGRLIVLRDISGRKQAEMELAQARDRAIEADRLKTELLAKVSHELRTPLGVILGYTEMLQMGIYGPLSEAQKQPTQEVVNSTNYLTNLVGDLLTQAQLNADKFKLNISCFTPTDLVEVVRAKMEPLARAKVLTFTTDITADVPAALYGDFNRLQQILLNLVGNAIKFTEQGSVRIGLYCPDPSRWAIQVADTGPGIPEDAQALIFEAFGQVDGSITREYSGVGLGLSIVKQLTELMDGRITLTSEMGQGSVFTVSLPLMAETES